jgi:hypothetical protein
MKWYKLAADPFAFESTKKPVGKAPEQMDLRAPKRWSTPIRPGENTAVPPPPQNSEAIFNEILEMLRGAEAKDLVALRDKLRGEGFWEGLIQQPKDKKQVSMTPEPGTIYEESGRTPTIRSLQETLKDVPPASPLLNRPFTEREKRLRRLEEGRP